MCPKRGCGTSRCGEGALGSFGGLESLSLGLSGFTHGCPKDGDSFSPRICVVLCELCCSVPVWCWDFGGNPLNTSQNLLVALLRLIVVSLTFIILMSKPPDLAVFTQLWVCCLFCVTRSPEHYPAFPAASPQHPCDKNTPGFGQATPGDATACPGSCAAVTTAKRCHHVTSVLQGMPWALHYHHQRTLPLLVPYHMFILLSKFWIAATTSVCLFFPNTVVSCCWRWPGAGDTVRTHGGRGIPISSLLFPFPWPQSVFMVLRLLVVTVSALCTAPGEALGTLSFLLALREPWGCPIPARDAGAGPWAVL